MAGSQVTRLTHWEGEPVEVWRALWGIPALEIYDLLGSTNDVAKDPVQGGRPHWSVILAEAQGQGRGRGGKSWYSPAGSGLWFSLVIPGGSVEWNALLPLRAGMAVAKAVEGDLASAGSKGVAVELKWPNDLLVMGRKIAGVLCETGPDNQLVAGVGINVRGERGTFPGALQETAGSLESLTGASLSRGKLMGGLLAALREGVEGIGGVLSTGELNEFSTRDALAGLRVFWVIAGRGVSRGISESGSLLLEQHDRGVVEVRAGSITITRDDGA
jgi:BirA family biotin operon repressor/biotin-[acetyl-CoA-carboxylase] ligase